MFDVSDALRATERAVIDHENAVERALGLAGDIARGQVFKNPGFTPRTGALQQATTYKVIRTSGGKLVRISNALDYAPAIDRGAKPHVITAKRARFLRFFVNGSPVFRRSVRHPGNKPYRFLRNATSVAFTHLEVLLEREMSRVAESFGD